MFLGEQPEAFVEVEGKRLGLLGRLPIEDLLGLGADMQHVLSIGDPEAAVVGVER